MSTLLERMMKTGIIKGQTMNKAAFFGNKTIIKTELPILNLALMGEIDGGLVPGLTVFAGPSKSYKTLLGLYCLKAFLEQTPEGVAFVYDSEGGITPAYLAERGIDGERVIYLPLLDVEQLKSDMVQRLQSIQKGDKVFILVDSIGNLASKKELDDAADGKNVADMTRAKSFKSLGRVITPYLKQLEIPCIMINHTYQTMELYSKDVVSGGCMVAGSEVITENGIKPIDMITTSDRVLTIDGFKPVEYVWTPSSLENGTPKCYRVVFEDESELIVSDKHRFMDSTSEWVYISDIEIDKTKIKKLSDSQPEMVVKEIIDVGNMPVYDLTVADNNQYITTNGVISHNTGVVYSSDTIFIIKKTQEKEGTEIVGWNFNINIEKSRYVREKAKFTFTVLYDGGIQKWSSLFELAEEAGFIEKVSMGWYTTVDPETGEVAEGKKRASAIENDDAFFEKLIKNKDFKEYCKKKYILGGAPNSVAPVTSGSTNTISSITTGVDEDDDEGIE